MKHLLLVAVLGCGGAAKKPVPQNTEPAGTAKVVERNREGGVIETKGERGTALERANNEMARHCGSEQYQIIQEGEELVAEGSTETTWRIHYLCTGPGP